MTTNHVALDVEMVGTGPKGSVSAPARIAVVDANGTVLMDSFVKPREEVTDYRTPYSGIKPGDLDCGLTFQQAREKVRGFIKDKILVGHDLKHDLDVLELTHNNVRDTAKHFTEGGDTPSLKHLAKKELNITTSDTHNPVEDAQNAMKIFNKNKW